MTWIGIIILAIGLILLYSKRDQQEEWLALKLFGYYFLGAFHFNINGLILPVGFIISLFLRPDVNKGIKRGAAIFGLVMMVISFIWR